ncbi:MAG: hypothetical protein LBJ01_06285 [Tannerella sp.]|nr:hypothetical protein [Tannerella sp.]
MHRISCFGDCFLLRSSQSQTVHSALSCKDGPLCVVLARNEAIAKSGTDCFGLLASAVASLLDGARRAVLQRQPVVRRPCEERSNRQTGYGLLRISCFGGCILLRSSQSQ